MANLTQTACCWPLLALWLTILPLGLAAQTLQLTGLGQPTRPLTAAEWAKLPRQTQQAPDKTGQLHRYEGVPVAVLLPLLKAPQGKALHGAAAFTQVLLVTAADRYQVVFALPELDSTFARQTVLLADRRDGQPLPPDAGPYQLVVPQEKRPARWVRGVTELRVVQVRP